MFNRFKPSNTMPDKNSYKRYIDKLSKATNLEYSVTIGLILSFAIPLVGIVIAIFLGWAGKLFALLTRVIVFFCITYFFNKKAYQGIITKEVLVFPEKRWTAPKSESGFVGGKTSGIAKGKEAVVFGLIFLIPGLIFLAITFRQIQNLLTLLFS